MLHSRIRTVTLPFLLAAAAAAPQAQAGTVSRVDDRFDDSDPSRIAQTLTYTARRGERNRVTVRLSAGGLRIRDRAGLRPGRGCRRTDAQRAFCSFGHRPVESQKLVVALGDRPDRLTVRGRTPALTGARLRGGPGDDRLRSALGLPAGFRGPAISLAGDGGDDRLSGGPAAEAFVAGSRPDGSDTFLGGRGRDLVSYARRRRGVWADLRGDRDDGARREGDRVGRDIEELRGGSGADRLVANRAVNVLAGGAGNDRLDGGRGRDLVLGGSGQDRLFARDTSPDVLGCGGNRADRAQLDALDLPSVLQGDPSEGIPDEGCARIDRRGARPLAVLDFNPTLDESNFVAPRFSVFAQRVNDVPVACPVDAPGRCRGRVRLFALGEEASAPFDMAPGVTAVLEPRVSARVGAAAMGERASVPARVTVESATGSSTVGSVSYAVSLGPPR